MRILGIDFGQKRIGLALSDPLGFTAQGLPTLEFKNRRHFLETLTALCLENEVTEVVIGLPVNMNGSHGPRATEVLQLVPLIEEALKRPVKTWDERLTSLQADRLMVEEGLSRRKQKLTSDRLAATLILQSYLDSKRNRAS